MTLVVQPYFYEATRIGLLGYLMTSLLSFCALTVVVTLLSMEGQRALGFHQKYLNLCSKDERRSYGFGSTWGWVINDRIFIFGWTIPLNSGWRLTKSVVNYLKVFAQLCCSGHWRLAHSDRYSHHKCAPFCSLFWQESLIQEKTLWPVGCV